MRFNSLIRPLSRLFRTAPPSTEKARAVAPNAASSKPLRSEAAAEGEEAQRAAAIRRLQDGEELRSLAGLGELASPAPPPSLARIAQERVAHLIDTGAMDSTVLCTAGSVPAKLSIAGLCSDPAPLRQTIAAIDDPQRIAALAIEGTSSRIRQLAARSVHDPAVLRQVLKDVRGKDKNVYKIIKQKLDAVRAEEQRLAQIESDVNALCEALERHGHRTYDVNYSGSFAQLAARWQTREVQASNNIRERAIKAIARCREVMSDQARLAAQQAAEAAREAAERAVREESIAHAALEAQHRDEAAARAAAQAAQIQEAEQQARAERLAAEALALRQIGGLISNANGALRDGNTGRAARLRHAIEEKLPAMPAPPAYLARQLQQLDVKLNELKEWKDYAVAPKRTALIEEMEGLIGSSEPPKVLADRIKQLQDDWKTISKGIVSDSESDWQRFHQAAESAFKPCRDYFEAQAKQRQSNIEKRKTVLERLLKFEAAQSGEHADFRSVAAVLREAPREWRQYSPVDRAAGLALQKDFDASVGRLQSRLDAWYGEHVLEKKLLIQRAQQLQAEEDSHDAVEAVKSLQVRWKKVGPAARELEQQLWHEFREHCDAVYQKRQQAYAEYAASLETNKQQATALCEEVEHVAALSGPELSEGAGKIPQWRAAFDALGEMPRTDQRALHDRFERALSLCQAAVQQQRARDKERMFTQLIEAARRIQAYGWAVARGADLSERETLKESAQTFIAGIAQLPKGGVPALNDAWAKADAAADLDAGVSEAALRTLCIRSEILADLPTPAQDQPLRREHQVHRLVEHMGQRSECPPDESDALALEWVRVGPVAPPTLESLLSRFLRCRRTP